MEIVKAPKKLKCFFSLQLTVQLNQLQQQKQSTINNVLQQFPQQFPQQFLQPEGWLQPKWKEAFLQGVF
jgi:hypothetical protein